MCIGVYSNVLASRAGALKWDEWVTWKSQKKTETTPQLWARRAGGSTWGALPGLNCVLACLDNKWMAVTATHRGEGPALSRESPSSLGYEIRGGAQDPMVREQLRTPGLTDAVIRLWQPSYTVYNAYRKAIFLYARVHWLWKWNNARVASILVCALTISTLTRVHSQL